MATRWQRALVTGASTGIGEAIARRLAAEGTDLVIVARNARRLQVLAAELHEAHGVDVEVLTADLGDRGALATVEARLGTADQPIDLLVNNAGYGFNGIFGEIPVEDEDAEIQVNILATVRLAHAAIRRWRAGGGVGRSANGKPVGGILNLSSIAAFQPCPSTANYGATKAYILSFSQALHEEQRENGIVVTCLCPGFTRTEFQERGNHDGPKSAALWQTADEVAQAGLDGVGSGRAVVVSGILNKSLGVGTRLIPMSLVRRLAGQVLKRGN